MLTQRAVLAGRTVANLGVAVGVDLIGDPQVVAQPGGIEGMDDYMLVDDQ